MTDTDALPRLLDPRSAYPKPPFPQPAPGPNDDVDSLRPRPDHGEGLAGGGTRLRDLRAIVTGGDSGIGRAAALAFAREGADVVVGYRQERDDAEATVDLIRAAGRRAVAVQGDLTDESACSDLIERTTAELGGLDILVNNAATQVRRDEIEDITTEEWERILRTNLTAPFWLCRAAARAMRPGASIINVASIQAAEPSQSLLAYATTKGGLVTFSKALATMLAPRGIRVNVVAPGPVWTPLVATTTAPEKLEQFGADTAFGRPAQPVELAGAFVYLASAEASFVTGAVIPVTGGAFFD